MLLSGRVWIEIVGPVCRPGIPGKRVNPIACADFLFDQAGNGQNPEGLAIRHRPDTLNSEVCFLVYWDFHRGPFQDSATASPIFTFSPTMHTEPCLFRVVCA